MLLLRPNAIFFGTIPVKTTMNKNNTMEKVIEAK